MRLGQLMLAVEIALMQLHRALAHADLFDVADVLRLQIGEFDLGRFDPAARHGQRRLERRRIDVEQGIADLEDLPFPDVDGDDRTGHVGGDHRLVGADIGVVGRDVAPARQPPVEAADQQRGRNDDHQDEPAQTGARRLGPLSRVASRLVVAACVTSSNSRMQTCLQVGLDALESVAHRILCGFRETFERAPHDLFAQRIQFFE